MIRKLMVGTLVGLVCLVFSANSFAQSDDQCQAITTTVNGVTVFNIVNCKEVAVQIEGTEVYRIASAIPVAKEATPIGPRFFLDEGSSLPLVGKVSVQIIAKGLNVRTVASIENNRPVGNAREGRYYEVHCVGDNGWYQIVFNGKNLWIHVVGEHVYAKIINPDNITIEQCTFVP